MLEQLKRGFLAAFRGMSMALGDQGVHRTYLRLMLTLLAMTLVLDAAGLFGLFTLTEVDAETVAWWVEWGMIFARVLGTLVILVGAPLLSILIANVAFPLFNEATFMAGLRAVNPSRAEQVAAGPGLPLTTSAGIAAIRLSAFVGMTIGAFLIGLIPVVGTVAGPVLQALITARAIGWELLDPYFDRMGLRWDDQRRFIREHRASVIGFGLPVAFMLAIPIVGPLLFGFAQAASAQLLDDILEAQVALPVGAAPPSISAAQ